MLYLYGKTNIGRWDDQFVLTSLHLCSTIEDEERQYMNEILLSDTEKRRYYKAALNGGGI